MTADPKKSLRFGDWWRNRRTICKFWDAKGEEDKHMTTWFQAACAGYQQGIDGAAGAVETSAIGVRDAVIADLESTLHQVQMLLTIARSDEEHGDGCKSGNVQVALQIVGETLRRRE